MADRRVGIPQDPNSPSAVIIDAGDTGKPIDLVAPAGVNVNGAAVASTGHTHSGAYVAGGERLRATGTVAETLPRNAMQGTNITGLVSGRQTFNLIWLDAGTIITTLAFHSWTTAGAGLTNQWFSLYSLNRTKLAVTVDDLTTGWGTFTRKTLALTAPYTVPTSGLYYAGIMIAATTVPSLVGAIASGGITQDPPILQGHDTTNLGLTTPATAPATAGPLSANTASGGCLYVRAT